MRGHVRTVIARSKQGRDTLVDIIGAEGAANKVQIIPNLKLYDQITGNHRYIAYRMKACTAIISGNIKNSSGQNLQGVLVEICKNGNAKRTTTTDSNGNYSFTDMLPADYRLTARLNGYKAKTQACTTLEDQTVTVNLTLNP